jgi:tRNA pseudouridine38-40 synthase
MRYFLQLAYDGKPYHGWQRQDNAHSVQQELEEALSTIFQEKIEVVGCGRTDTGVHAKEFYGHFDLDQDEDQDYHLNEDPAKEVNPNPDLHPNLLIHKLNSLLPASIAIYDCFEVPGDLHARFSAKSRTYEYLIHTRKEPFLDGRSYLRKKMEIDLEKWNETGKLLLGEHDFSAFSKSGTQVKTNLCDIQKVEWSKTESGYRFEIKANRFLRNMVRAVVGSFIDTDGDATRMQAIVDSKNRSEAGTSVPGHALYLIGVEYERSLSTFNG